jgi:hypothetical protein
LNIASQSSAAGELVENLASGPASAAPVSEPTSLVLFGSGALALAARRRRAKL